LKKIWGRKGKSGEVFDLSVKYLKDASGPEKSEVVGG